MNIAIIGAGIGGLTTAIALKQKGFNVEVYEQAPNLTPKGAGIIIASNAMQVLTKLGCDEAIKSCGNELDCIKISSKRLITLSKVDLRPFKQKFGVQNIAIHRGDLQEILIQKLGKEYIHLNKKLVGIKSYENKVELTFSDESSIKREIVIGADGINSLVRKKIFAPSQLRETGQLCWRGVVTYDLLPKFNTKLCEAWGAHSRFGFVKINSAEVYWYALITNKGIIPSNKSEMINYFKSYHPMIYDILKHTPNSFIHFTEIADLNPINTWHQDNICLIGDAAHASTPNLGQGACQAIEDAYVLAACLATDRTHAFENFQKIRKPKADLVVNTSWQIGKIAHLNFLFSKIRNLGVFISGNKSAKKQIEIIYTLPDLP